MKLKFLNSRSPLFEFRWFILVVMLVTAFMVWHDITGGRMFATSNQQQWSSSGPGYHK